MSSPILVGVDPGRGPSSGDQLALGLVLARAFRAQLVLASVYLNNPLTSSPLMQEAAHDEADAALRAAAELVGSPDVVVRAVGANSPAAGLYDLAIETGARMLAVGSTHRGPVGRVLLGAVTDSLVNGAPCTVAIAPHGSEISGLEVVGVAFEDTTEGHAALEEAAQIAGQTGARIRAWCVVPAGDNARERRQRAEAALGEALAATGAPAEPRVEEGDPVGVLTDASAELDVLVCGSRGFGPVNTVLLGSVTRRLAQQAQCALLVVPHAVSSP